jgi:hypothetical protein
MALNPWKKAKPQIVITFDKEGEMEVEGHGFVGKACEKASKFIESLLGKVMKRTKKPEAYKQGVEKVQHTQH